jgi:hypothetical protein
MTTTETAFKDRLIAIASLLGLGYSVELLQNETNRISSMIEQMFESPRPKPAKKAPKLAKPFVKKRAMTAEVRPDGDAFIVNISDGRVWRSKRRRDLVLRARRQGLVVKIVKTD